MIYECINPFSSPFALLLPSTPGAAFQFPTVPVIAVPTTYNHVTEDELQDAPPVDLIDIGGYTC
jgi:hypothetical protein